LTVLHQPSCVDQVAASMNALCHKEVIEQVN
jgi:hypothetical protein